MYYIKVSQNVRLAVDDLNDNAKKTIFFLHGWPFNKKIFEYQMNVLPELGFRVIALDMRGFGESDAPVGGYSYNQLAKDLYKVIASLRTGHITLAGFSMGASVALRYMSLFQGYSVSKLILISAAAPSFIQRPGYSCGMTKDEADNMITLAYHDRAKLVGNLVQKLFITNQSKDMRDWFRNIGMAASGHGTIKTAESLKEEDLRADLKSVKVKTGIFHGKLDKICSYHFAEELHKNINNAKLFTFEQSGHALFIDQMEEFNLRLVEFLND